MLRRPAGSNGRFAEHSKLPTDLGRGEGAEKGERRRQKPKKRASPKISDTDRAGPGPSCRSQRVRAFPSFFASARSIRATVPCLANR